MASAEGKNPSKSLTQRRQSALPFQPLQVVAEQGCRFKRVLCSASKMVLLLADAGIVALSPRKWAEGARDRRASQRAVARLRNTKMETF